MMPSKKDKSKEVTVVAELTVTSPVGVEVIKSFDAAWHRSLELPKPVHTILNGFVRKDA